MRPGRVVCVDASLAVKVVVTEEGSDQADALFEQWSNQKTQLIAPTFFVVEMVGKLQTQGTFPRGRGGASSWC